MADPAGPSYGERKATFIERGLDPATVKPVGWIEWSLPYDRAAVSIVDGRSNLIIPGYRDQLPVRAP
jgi:hypothetical protein